MTTSPPARKKRPPVIAFEMPSESPARHHPTLLGNWLQDQGLDVPFTMIRPILQWYTLDDQRWSSSPHVFEVYDIRKPSKVVSLTVNVNNIVFNEVNTMVAQVQAWPSVQGDPTDHAPVFPIVSYRLHQHLNYWHESMVDALRQQNASEESHSVFEMMRVSTRFKALNGAVDEPTFVRLRAQALNPSHGLVLNMDDELERWVASSKLIGPDGDLSKKTKTILVQNLQAWPHCSAEEHQAMAKTLFLPHAEHAPLFDHAVERWHLESALPSQGPTPSIATRRSRL